MQRLWPRTRDEQLAYHLADGRAVEFDKSQPGRIQLARRLVEDTLHEDRLKIVELGCGAGDISGTFSDEHDVFGFDVVPAAEVACAARWPNMHFRLGPVEEVEPFACDLLVLCEFLEHVHDPVSIVKAWLPQARWAIIGHPLHEPNPPFEPGHIWSYTIDDWDNWLTLGGHTQIERVIFPMAPWPDMVIGRSVRNG